MIKILATINALLGTVALTLYAIKSKSTLLKPDSDDYLIIAVGFFCVLAATIGLRRFSFPFYLIGIVLITHLAHLVPINEKMGSSEMLKTFSSSLSKHYISASSAFAFLLIGCLFETFLPFKSKNNPIKSQKKPEKETTTKLVSNQHLKENPKHPDKKIIQCPCGKKMRVKVSSKKVRCPQCQKVVSVT